MTLVVQSSLIQSTVCLQAGGPGGQYQCPDMTLVVPSSLIQSPVCLQAGGSVRPVPAPGHDVSRPVFSHTVYCMFAGRGAGTPVPCSART